ncbi:MAG: type II secretion system ATPase GspE [Thauera propionica]|uniref:type II secretion system ATPase GspE n=1 Tax=Thauera propionica TaxID=2019431 RepID=UPI0023F28D47|nr:type II secretion system ATPase GspE [Thauera propionica]MDD3677195.1 type II secretion system ATPase GspE [Thauera propionica]MDY0046817.1 type II secretion system ATPase GspE [Thauera propionica]
MSGTTSLPYGFARSHGVLVRAVHPDHAELVVRDDVGLGALAEARRALGLPLKLQTVARAQFDAQLADAYGGGERNAADVVADVGQEADLEQLMTEMPAVEDLLDSQDDAPIIRMINALLTQAVRDHASDVHIEPYEQSSVVRLRRDGVLQDIARPHRGLHAAMASRIKIMANLDIAEKRLPQDGRISLRLAGRQIDVRVSTLPTTHGERLVLRLLDKSAGQLGLDALGMDADTQAAFHDLLGQPHGILLVTGPTGSGKSTTLYAALRTLDAGRLNIVTVEDPVEFDLPGVGQIQVNPRIDLDFARALRAILRQDPDVIMIGEIRDLETARIAVQASLTGHLVLATLHTNDAAAAVNRLIDMGIEPFLLASTLRGVLAQRLVRKLCPACKTPDPLAEAGTRADDSAPNRWRAHGCPACGDSGYRGRIGLYELMRVDGELEALIHDGRQEAELRRTARAAGTRSLMDDGMRHVLAGTTSFDELQRVMRD